MKSFLILSLLFLAIESNAYVGSKFKLSPPEKRIEEPNMFGSDVMFLKSKEQGEGAIFVKYITNDKDIVNIEEFLLDKVKSSKSLKAKDISKIETLVIDGEKLKYVTFKNDENSEEVFTGMIKHQGKSYVFFMLKDSPENFEREKNRLLEALKSFSFVN